MYVDTIRQGEGILLGCCVVDDSDTQERDYPPFADTLLTVSVTVADIVQKVQVDALEFTVADVAVNELESLE